MKFVHYFNNIYENLVASYRLLIKKALRAENVEFEYLSYNFQNGGEFLIPIKTNTGKQFTCKITITVEGDDEEDEE